LSVFFLDGFLEVGFAHRFTSPANLRHGLGLHGLVARAALRVKETQKFLQRFRIRAVPEKCALAPNLHQPLVLEFFQMMREGRTRNAQLFLDFPHDQAAAMSGVKKLRNAKPGFGSPGREHAGVAGHLCGVFPALGNRTNISMIAETSNVSSAHPPIQALFTRL
jgi:hypothetical protein